MLRILIADDHAIVRHGLKQILAEEFDQAVIHETGTGQGVLDTVKSAELDVVILDLNLPDKPGLDVLKEVKALHPPLPVVILSFHPEEQYALRALKAGASGYLTKESAPEELISALRKILAGGTYVSATLAEHLAGTLSGEAPGQTYHSLSDRELQVLCLIARGKTVAEIADNLSLSIKTVSTYRARLLEKLRLDTTAELIRYALDNRLVE